MESKIKLKKSRILNAAVELFFVLTSAYAFATFSLLSKFNFSIKTVAYTIFIYLILSLLFLKFVKIRNYITCNKCEIVYPRILLKDLKISLDSIKHFQEIGTSKRDFGIAIGIIGKPALIVDRTLFLTEEDYTNFKATIINATKKNNIGVNYSESSIRNRSIGKHAAEYIFTLIWISAYILFSENLAQVSHNVALSGGITKDLFSNGETYRIFSSFYIHKDISHVLLNIILFAVMARYLTILIGSVRMVNILLLSALFAALSSFMFSPYDLVYGASGGIFGLFGAYFFIKFKFRDDLPALADTISNRTLIILVVAEFLLDTFLTGIDLTSHVAGFLFGVFYAFILFHGKKLNLANRGSVPEIIICILISTLYAVEFMYFYVTY